MNWLDIVILIILSYAVIKGAMSGLIKSAGNFFAVLIALTCYAVVTPLVDFFLNDVLGASQGFSAWSSRIVSIVLIIVVLKLLVHVLNHLINATPLGLINHLGGALVNLVIWLLICSFAFNVFEFIDQFTKPISQLISSTDQVQDKQTDRDKSIFYYPIKEILPAIVPGNAFPKQDDMASVRVDEGKESK